MIARNLLFTGWYYLHEIYCLDDDLSHFTVSKAGAGIARWVITYTPFLNLSYYTDNHHYPNQKSNQYCLQ